MLLAIALPLAAQPAPTSSEAAHQQFVFAYRLLQRNELKLAKDAFDDYLGKFPTDEKRGDALYYKALIARREGATTQAIAALENAAPPRLVPDHAVQLLRGQLYSDAGQHDKAVAALEKIDVTNLEPGDKASVYFLRGLAYRAMNNLPAAAGQLQQASQLESPLRAKALIELARVQSLMEKRADAIAVLEQAMKVQDPAVNAEAARFAGDLAYKETQYDRAIGFYDIVLTNHVSSPHFGPSVVGVLWSRFQQGRFGQVLEVFNRHKEALKDLNDRVTAWYLAGSAQQQLGEHEKAADLLSQILTTAAGSSLEDKVLYRLAASQFELGKYDPMKQTIARLRRDHLKSPHIADADFLVASAAARQGDQAGGGTQLTQIITAGASHPYYTQSLLQRARLYDSSNLFEPAAKDYRSYLEYAKANKDKVDAQAVAVVTLRLIDLNYRNNHYQEAASDAQALLASNAGLTALAEAETMYRLGLAQIKLNQFEPASATLTAMLDKQPKSPYSAEARYYRGLLWMALKQTDKAMSDLADASKVQTLPLNLRVNAMRLISIHQRERKEADAAAQTTEDLEKLITVKELRTDEQLWMARYHTDRGKPRYALKYLEPVLSGGEEVSGSQRAEAMLLAARGLRDAGDTKAAAKAFREVVAMGQGFGLQARLELARTLVLAKETDEALGEYDGLMSAEEAQVAAHAIYESGSVYREQSLIRKRNGNPTGAAQSRQEARSRFLRVIVLYGLPELSPLPQLSYINLAELALEDQKPDEALKHWTELKDNYADSPYASYAKAMLALQQGNRNDAQFLLGKLAEKKTGDAQLDPRVEAQLKTLATKP